jgi:hypothetical protein
MAMNSSTLRLSEIANLPEAERKRLYTEFMRNGIVPNGEVEELDRQVAAFEQVYEVSSDTMQRQIAEGSRRETAEIGRWLMLLELRNRVRQQTS